jgi:hypothetical protein
VNLAREDFPHKKTASNKPYQSRLSLFGLPVIDMSWHEFAGNRPGEPTACTVHQLFFAIFINDYLTLTHCVHLRHSSMLAHRIRKVHSTSMATKTRPHVLSITLTSEELYLFQELAKEQDMPMTNMVRSWLRRELAKSTKKTA